MLSTQTLRRSLVVTAAILVAPWALLWGIYRAVRWLYGSVRTLLRFPRALSDTLYCVQGHPNSAVGYWRCTCGAAYSGYAFARCHVCGATAGYVDGCATCGLSVPNPLGRRR